MMYRVETKVEIEQQPTKKYPDRKKKMTFDFLVFYEVKSSWENQTDTASVKLPKNIIVKDENDKDFVLEGLNKNLGACNDVPQLITKGDKIKIFSGYRYYNDENKEILDMPMLFQGYVTEVVTGEPFEIKCEDNMWKLKQLPAPSKQWPASKYTLQKILEECLEDTEFKVSDFSKEIIEYSTGHFVTKSQTVAEVLAVLKKDARVVSFFRGNKLHIGYPVYNDDIANNLKFVKQCNIITDDLAYKCKGDVHVSAVATSSYTKVKKKTKDGNDSTKTEKLEILIYLDDKNEFTYKIKEKGSNETGLPPDKEGIKRSFNYANIQDPDVLYQKSLPDLLQYNYTGFRGTFTTFGLPYVKHGDNVELEDLKYPEKNGVYKVKSVEYSGGTIGLRQKVELDYKIGL